MDSSTIVCLFMLGGVSAFSLFLQAMMLYIILFGKDKNKTQFGFGFKKEGLTFGAKLDKIDEKEEKELEQIAELRKEFKKELEEIKNCIKEIGKKK